MRTRGRLTTIFVLVIGVGLAHYSCQLYLVGHSQLHTVFLKFLYIPILLAAFWWGLRGGGWVSLACAMIFFVDVFRFWNPQDYYHYNKISEGFLFLIVGLLLGWMVDLDRRSKSEKIQAEKRADTEHVRAIMDPLTRCFNRHHMDQKLQEFWQKAREEGREFSLMMIDLNEFKRINDKYGHLMGDRVLESTVKTIFEYTRKNDLVFRYGGDEFLLLLPKTSQEACYSLARRLIDEMSKLTFCGEEMKIFKASFSVGVMEYKPTLGDIPEMLSKLDEALYRAKKESQRIAVAS